MSRDLSRDIVRLRDYTPGVAKVLHFNNAGASLPPRPVTESVLAHVRREAEIGGYEAAAEAAAALDAVYASAARLVGGQPHEIAVVENATRAWDMVFYGFDWRPGDRVLTAMAEYASNYIAYLQAAQKYGIEVVAIPNDAHGQIDAAALDAAVDARTRLIAVTHVPTNGGLVNPAAAVGRVARRHGVPFLLDACQSVGQMPVDVDAIGCDMLSATARKYLRGPRGVGFLWVREAWIERLEPPFLDMHAATWSASGRYKIRADARRFETWEGNVAGKLGMGVAIDYALCLGLDAIQARVTALAARLRAGLAAIPGVVVHDIGQTLCGIVSFTVAGLDATAVTEALHAQAVNVSVSYRSSTLLDMELRSLPNLVRASVHYYNDEEEVARFASAVAGLVRT